MVPINFALTERARNWILASTQQLSAEENADFVPTISCAIGLKDPDGNWREVRSITLGFFHRSQLRDEDVQQLNGIELVFNANTPEDLAFFAGRTIDYSDDRGLHFAV